MLLVGDYLRKIILCNSNTGKPILKQRQRATSCKLSTDGQKIVVTTSRGVIHISDCARGCIIKSLITYSEYYSREVIYSCSFSVDGKQLFAKTGKEFFLQDIADSKLHNLSLNTKKSDSCVYSLRLDGQQISVFDEADTVFFHDLSQVDDLSIQTLAIRGTNNKGLNLLGVIANSSFKLSEENITLLRKRGDYGIFNESMIKKLFPSSSTESEGIKEVVLINKCLTSTQARIIGSDLLWINLQRLDLSGNDIHEEGGKAIGSNKIWTNLEELILIRTEIGDETAKAIATNQKFQKLKKLDLSQNKIKADGALAIGVNNIWKKLVTLDLGSNQIVDNQALIFLCSNKTWEHLQSLFLIENPAILEASDVCKILQGIGSKSLKMLVLPQAKFDGALLQCLKYSASENVINLSLAKSGYNDIYAEIIAANTTWSNLKKLDLSKNLISDKGSIKIGSNTSWINLEELNLSGNNLGAQTAIAIGDNTTWSKLRVLNLNGNKIGTEGCYAIGNNKTWTELHTLELQDNLIGSKGVVALCQNKTWIKLQTLNLEKNLIDADGARELSRNKSWTNLQTLNLYNNKISTEGAAELSRNTSWINLKTLNLYNNSVGDKGAAELARNTSSISLKTLNLDYNSIGDKGASELARNTSWINLQTLTLYNNSISAEGAAELARNTSWINLQTLNLYNNSIGAEGAAELARNTSWINLQTLDLRNNSIGGEGAAELSRNTSWINLQILELSSNSIGAEGAAELSRNNSWINLKKINLYNNWIGDEGAAELARNTSWINLQTLNLEYNKIGAEGAAELARNASWVNLQTLNLYSNSICDKGAAELARNTSWINLQILDLYNNSIGAKGAAELAMNTSWINLQTLNLECNSIGAKGAAELARNTSWINLQTLNLEYNSIGEKGASELGEKDSFYKRQERLNSASKGPKNWIIEEAILLSAKEPTSREICDQAPKEATEICREDQDSHTDLNITYSHHEQQLEPSKASSSNLRTHLFALESKINSFDYLQDLDFTRCLLGKQGIKALCGSSNLSSLKSLILIGNPIRNDGVKFISETSNWLKLQTLNLCNIEIDYDGVKWLAMNESWTRLKELDLSKNPLIGDLGAISLFLNRTWTSLKTLGLWGCKVGKLGVIASRHPRNYTVLFAKDKTTIEVENQNFSFKKVSFRTTRNTRNHEKSLPNSPLTCSNWGLQNFKCEIRGGSPQGDGSNDSSGIDYSALLTKFQQYKEKILDDSSLEKELKLFIEVQASTIPANLHGTNNKNSSDVSQHLELYFDLRRRLLYSEDSEVSKILLLTGQAGSGKSLFCKHLQRELISDWSQKSESEERNWFPIYVELSSLKNPKLEAISETLSRELSLTNEEILFLEASEQNNLCLPRLLFIFDGYDTIEDIQAFHSLRSKQDFMNHNFFVLNKIDGALWKDAKFIITCREENLQKVQRRDLLFAPINNTESSELSVASRSLLQRKVEPFSNEQITCYLKKYYYYDSKDIIEEGPSWHHVKVFEKMIDDYQLREIARIPFMLWIIYQILPKLVINGSEQINQIKSSYPRNLRKRFLIEFFVNEVIQSMAKESLDAFNSSVNKEESKNSHKEEDHQQLNLHMKEITQQAQSFALKLSGYSISHVGSENIINDINSNALASKLYPLVTWDSSHSRVKFGYLFLLEFLVAKSIEEEIREVVPYTQEEWLKIKKDLLINQRLLTSEASDVAVTFFLIDAIKDKRLTPDQFINLIHLSRQKELDQENEGKELSSAEHSSSKSLFAIAASNAITILNAAGYDFSHQDLTNIDIPSANLSFGNFEGTNFMNANLAGVDFTGARLKGASFVNSNMKSVEFGEIPSLSLDKQKIKNIAYSPDEEYFAVDVGAETVIFEVVDMQRNHFKESRRVAGRFLNWGKQSRTQVVTIEGDAVLMEKEQLEKVDEREIGYEDDTGYDKFGNFGFRNRNSYEGNPGSNVRFCIWDVISGKAVQNLSLPTGNKRILSFNSERKEVITLNTKQVQKCDFTSNSWIKFPIRISNGVKNYHSLAKNANMLLVGDYLRKIILCNSTTGKLILKQRQRATSCKLSTDGQKIVVGTSRGVIHISDVVRGRIIKSLITYSEYYSREAIYSCSFNTDGNQILSSAGNKLNLQDIADSQRISLSLISTKAGSYTYCLRPDGQQVAVVEEMHTVSFKNFPTVADLSTQTPTIRGTNNEGLNLKGVIANSSVKLSEENIALLRKRGDYGIFCESMIKKLFTTSSTDSQDVREVVLIWERLAPIHARILGSDLLWINLQKLDLSSNDIDEEGGKAIGNNKIWANLEELTLMRTEVGDETAKAIANNQKFQKLKKLDLRQNKIKADGALAIGANNIWKKLLTLDLSSNQISDKQALIFLCRNKTWKYLQSLLLVDNPALLETSDVCKILEGIASKSLEILALTQVTFEQVLLHCLKYSVSESVINLSLAKSGYNDIHAEIIAANTTWTTLQKLDLSKNLISDKGGIKIGSNTSWINLEELDLSDNNLGVQTAVAIGDNKAWSKLRVLNLNGNKVGTEGCYAIGNNKTWTELQTLELQESLIGSKGVVALCQNKTWNKLQTLNLEKNLIDVEGAGELSRNTSWMNLQELNLEYNSIDDNGATELSRNSSWINLQILNLGNNSIGTEGAAKLSSNTSWIKIQTLDLRTNSIGAEGAGKLSRNRSWINLQTLNLAFNKIGNKGAAELSRNVSWINLQTLNLGNNSIGAEGAVELAKNTSWINLQTFNLGNNSMGTEGAAGLSRNASWINLKTFDLGNNSIGAEGVAKLARNTCWINLQTLNLYDNSIGAQGTAELARNTCWINLKTLNLYNNSIGDKGAADLGRNTSWINLQTLLLRNNSIGAEGAAELARNASWINLQTLDLGKNSIGNKGAAELARNTSWINLQTLDLEDNSIGAEAAGELARNTSWINLQTLHLRNNKISAEGAAKLAKNTSWINLQTLNLYKNSIGNKGAAELASNTSWINLQTLDLRNNSIGDKGVAQLARNKSWINLQSLNLAYNSIGAKGAAELARNTTWPNKLKIND